MIIKTKEPKIFWPTHLAWHWLIFNWVIWSRSSYCRARLWRWNPRILWKVFRHWFKTATLSRSFELCSVHEWRGVKYDQKKERNWQLSVKFVLKISHCVKFIRELDFEFFYHFQLNVSWCAVATLRRGLFQKSTKDLDEFGFFSISALSMTLSSESGGRPSSHSNFPGRTSRGRDGGGKGLASIFFSFVVVTNKTDDTYDVGLAHNAPARLLPFSRNIER